MSRRFILDLSHDSLHDTINHDAKRMFSRRKFLLLLVSLFLLILINCIGTLMADVAAVLPINKFAKCFQCAA